MYYKIFMLAFILADAYVLQLQKYEMPPSPVVSQSSVKQPIKIASPRPSLKPPLSSPTPKHPTQLSKTTIATMAAPGLPSKITASPISTPGTAHGTTPLTNVHSQQKPTGSPVVAAAQPTQGTTSTAASPLKRVIQTTIANTASSSTPSKQVVTTQAVLQAQAPGATTPQALTLVRTPMQLPPGIHATMITNAKGVPMMKLEGPGLQGTSPVTLMTSQVGTAGLQGATIVRMAAPSSTTVTASTLSNVVKVSTPASSTTTPSTTIKKIPVQSPTAKPPTTAASQSVVKQPVPVTLPANIPPGTQIKVLSPSGQLTPLGAGGVPLQLALQNIRAQLPPGMQLQQIKAGANTIFQAVPIAATKTATSSTPQSPAASPAQSSASTTVTSTLAQQTTALASLVKPQVGGVTKIPGVTLVSQLGTQLKVLPSLSTATIATTAALTQVAKTPQSLATTVSKTVTTTTMVVKQIIPTVTASSPQAASTTTLQKPAAVSLVKPTVIPINLPTAAAGIPKVAVIPSPSTATTASLISTRSLLSKTTSALTSVTVQQISKPVLTIPKTTTANTPGIPVTLPLTRVTKAVTTPVVTALTTPLVSSTIPSTKQAIPNVSSSLATTQKAPLTSVVQPKAGAAPSSSLLPTTVAASIASTSKTALTVNGNVATGQATNRLSAVQQKVNAQ